MIDPPGRMSSGKEDVQGLLSGSVDCPYQRPLRQIGPTQKNLLKSTTTRGRAFHVSGSKLGGTTAVCWTVRYTDYRFYEDSWAKVRCRLTLGFLRTSSHSFLELAELIALHGPYPMDEMRSKRPVPPIPP